MHKYGGSIIHQSRDPHGLLEIVEDGYSRSLHFGSEPKQSSMDLHDRLRLPLAYTRAMMTALLLQPAPRRVLLLGLGGGSLAKFLLHHFPGCHIDAVEYRAQVYKLACGYFGLPVDARLQVHIADAGDFVYDASTDHGSYDLILVDAFTDSGIAPATCGLGFFDACRLHLAADGVLAANLWSSDRIRLEAILQNLRDSYDNRLLTLPVEGKANIVALATLQGKPRREIRRLGERARELQQQLDIEFIAFHNSLRLHNRYFWL